MATRSSSRLLLQSSVRNGGTNLAGRHLSPTLAVSTLSTRPELLFFDRRSFSSEPRDTTGDVTTFGSSDTSSSLSVDETLNQLFAENSQAAASATDALQTVAETWTPTWYNLADQAIVAVQYFHNVTGLEYGWSIVGVTALLRLALTPIMISAQRTSSRMAHLNPELIQMRARYEALGTPSRQDQLQQAKQMKALFKRYQVNPLYSMLAFVQFPFFLGMFFGLQKMDRIYPEELANGGILWFPDLTVPDPYFMLPLLTGASFLLTTEVNKDQMKAINPGQGSTVINFFRLMGVAMVPFLMTFDTSMLCYWTANNLFTATQMSLLNQKYVRRALGIWERPKPIPGQEVPSLMGAVQDLAKRISGQQPPSEAQIMERHNQTVETRKRAASMMREAREKRKGISGTKNP